MNHLNLQKSPTTEFQVNLASGKVCSLSRVLLTCQFISNLTSLGCVEITSIWVDGFGFFLMTTQWWCDITSLYQHGTGAGTQAACHPVVATSSAPVPSTTDTRRYRFVIEIFQFPIWLWLLIFVVLDVYLNKLNVISLWLIAPTGPWEYTNMGVGERARIWVCLPWRNINLSQTLISQRPIVISPSTRCIASLQCTLWSSHLPNFCYFRPKAFLLPACSLVNQHRVDF